MLFELEGLVTSSGKHMANNGDNDTSKEVLKQLAPTEAYLLQGPVYYSDQEADYQ